MSWLKESESQYVYEILASQIHKKFTDVADKLHALGFMNEPDRKELSTIIGETLDFFRKQVTKRVFGLTTKKVEDKQILKAIGK